MTPFNVLNRKFLLNSFAIASLTLAGCAAMTEQQSAFDGVENQLSTLSSNADAQELVPVAIYEAEKAIKNAKKSFESKTASSAQNHLIYVADKKVQLAQLEYETKLVERQHADLIKEREDIIMAARVMELANVRGEARASQLEAIAKAEELKAKLSTVQRNLSENSAKLAANEAMASGLQQEKLAAESKAAALMSQQQAADAKFKALEARMAGIETQRTSRGLVATINGVVFDTGKTTIHAGVARSLDPIIEALQENTELQITIEGHTDNVGNADFNQQLSEGRAAAVKALFVSKGINANRIMTAGLGLNYPIATNATEAGRQRNRRVEVIFNN